MSELSIDSETIEPFKCVSAFHFKVMVGGWLRPLFGQVSSVVLSGGLMRVNYGIYFFNSVQWKHLLAWKSCIIVSGGYLCLTAKKNPW